MLTLPEPEKSMLSLLIELPIRAMSPVPEFIVSGLVPVLEMPTPALATACPLMVIAPAPLLIVVLPAGDTPWAVPGPEFMPLIVIVPLPVVSIVVEVVWLMPSWTPAAPAAPAIPFIRILPPLALIAREVWVTIPPLFGSLVELAKP